MVLGEIYEVLECVRYNKVEKNVWSGLKFVVL